MIETLIKELGEGVGVALPDVRVTGDDPVLPSVFPVGAAAAACAGAATAAVAAYWRPVAPPEALVDVRHAAVAFQSERHFQADGENFDVWAPLSGDYRADDGWVKLHCNFDHHRDAALRALGLPAGATKEDVARACESRTALDVEEAVTREGGCAGAMRSRAGWLTHPQARVIAEQPLVGLTRLPDSSGESGSPGISRASSGERPLSGVRVLDLTRVIAGPVAARTLAAHGAEVLRVGAAHLPEVPGLVVETAFGKRSCHIDLCSEPEALRDLVRQADVVIQAYRPGALNARGFGPADLAAMRPGIVCVDISAYGSRGPWGGRRGFDSLVQMVCGIAHENGDGSRPAPLPAQALDHGSGFLTAFGAVAALLRRRAEGGSWHVEVSLARTAKWLDDLGRVDGAGVPQPSADGLLATMPSAFGTLTYVRPPGLIAGAEPYWASPPPRQGEHPAEWATATGRG
ncbi:CoA transferase [Sphaerimonospora thailandensis]|uniref:CoA transferase n=1 Tax=Sphaerimonospora thailandensis TaxID=795644 RepID=A0A8J3RFB9_9ACTN|nr:CoA transferase [Sphaerimonospora thailandensis]GIH72699.1 CoA transferase [Sphaerimonospora thailandensis]